jgi:nucleotide-binding universal stress UspA family protein
MTDDPVVFLSPAEVDGYIELTKAVKGAIERATARGLTRDAAIGCVLQLLLVMDAIEPFGLAPRALLKLLADDPP